MARQRRHYLRRYILGFPGDTKESILRDVEIIKRELPLDLLEFFFLTPLPGSEDHQKLSAQGVWMDPDLKQIRFEPRVSHHPKMSDEEWEEPTARRGTCITRRSMSARSCAATAANPRGRIRQHDWPSLVVLRDDSLRGGASARRGRPQAQNSGVDRRARCPRESALRFYPRYAGNRAQSVGELSLYREWTVIRHEVTRDPNTGITRSGDCAAARESSTRDLYHATSGGEAARLAAAARRDPRPRRIGRGEQRRGISLPGKAELFGGVDQPSHTTAPAERRTNSR